MGTSGHKIFEDDFAVEIRESYLEKLFDGQSNEQATDLLIQENEHADIDERSVFWLALASVQFEYGRLLDRVKNKAIELIDSGEDLVKWNGDKKRAKELQNLKSKLLSEQPSQKKLVKRKVLTRSGDVFAFRYDPEFFAFGRVIKDGYIAVYQFKSSTSKLKVEDVIREKVAFLVSTTNDGFYDRKWKIIGNRPLEKIFTDPIYFFHVPVGSVECSVFNIWEDAVSKVIPEADCKKMKWGHFGIEQWGSYSTPHLVQRLKAKLENRPYQQGYLPENWEALHFRRSRID